MNRFPLLIAFPEGTTVFREKALVSGFPIVRNGPPGTFVMFPGRFRVSLPTDQIVFADDRAGHAEIGFGGMSFDRFETDRLVFHRVRELHAEDRLSPARSQTMILQSHLVTAVYVDGTLVWPRA